MFILPLEPEKGIAREAGQAGIRQPAAFLGLVPEEGGPAAWHWRPAPFAVDSSIRIGAQGDGPCQGQDGGSGASSRRPCRLLLLREATGSGLGAAKLLLDDRVPDGRKEADTEGPLAIPDNGCVRLDGAAAQDEPPATSERSPGFHHGTGGGEVEQLGNMLPSAGMDQDR